MISVELTVTVTDTATGEQDHASASFTVGVEGEELENVPGFLSPGEAAPGHKI